MPCFLFYFLIRLGRAGDKVQALHDPSLAQ